MRLTIVSNGQAQVISASLCLLLAGGIGCTPADPAALPPGTPEPDRYLFELGSTLVEDEGWGR